MEKVSENKSTTGFNHDLKPSRGDVLNDRQAKKGRKHAETISSLAGTIAFAAAAYGSGNYFSIVGAYDPAIAISTATIAVIGSVIVLLANRSP